jgi:hypothetical protein
VTRALVELERLEHRVLGAVRFVDSATDREVPGPLELAAVEGRARFVRSRSGVQVLWSWSELDAHAAAFPSPPAAPAVGSLPFRFDVRDPSGVYLPRRVTLDLPRDPDPARRDDPDSLFQPAVVSLYRSPAAPTGTNWAVVRTTVLDEDTGDHLGGTLLRVTRNGQILARGLTDGRGEGVLPVVGIPMLTFDAEADPGDEEDDGAVVVDTVAVTVEAIVARGAGTRMAGEDVRAGRRAPVPVVDPDAVEADGGAPRASVPLDLGARRSYALTLTVDLP